MSLKKMTLGKEIAEEFKFNGHNVSKGEIVEIVNRIFYIIERHKLKESMLTTFMEELNMGKHGTLNKNPMDLVFKFYTYIDKNRQKLI